MITEILDVVPEINGENVALDGPENAETRFLPQTHIHLCEVGSVPRYVQFTAAWPEKARLGIARLLSIAGPFGYITCAVVISLLSLILGHHRSPRAKRSWSDSSADSTWGSDCDLERASCSARTSSARTRDASSDTSVFDTMMVSSSNLALPPCLSVGWRSINGPGPSTPLDDYVTSIDTGCPDRYPSGSRIGEAAVVRRTTGRIHIRQDGLPLVALSKGWGDREASCREIGLPMPEFASAHDVRLTL